MRPSWAGALIPHFAPLRPCLDGPVWTQNVMPDERYHAIVYGAGIFLAGGSDAGGSAVTASSTDGITWAAGVTPPNFGSGGNGIRGRCLAFGGGRFVCAGNFVAAAYSSDGVSWVGISLSCDKTWLYYAAGKFVFVSVSDNLIRLSSDGGATWVPANLPATRAWQSGAYGNGIHVIANTDTQPCARSLDNGLNWTAGGTMPAFHGGNLAFGNGVFVGLPSNSSNSATYSLDNGLTWQSSALPQVSLWADVEFQQGVFLAATNNGDNVAVSVDGINWAASVHLLPAPFSGFVTYTTDGRGRYAAIQQTNPGTTIGAWGQC